jgi:AcrR family transcriptional regulator
MEHEQKRRSSSRTALLAAALDEFSEKGYETATLGGIAERAGVTTGAIYNLFDSKLDLLVATIDAPGLGEFWRQMGRVADLPWDEALGVLTERLAHRPAKSELLLLDVIVLARRDPAVASMFRTALESTLGAIAQATREGSTAGLVDPAVDPDDLSRLLVALSFGLLVLEALDQPGPTPEAFRTLGDVLLQASRSAEPAPTERALARLQARTAMAERATAAQHAAIAAAAEEGMSLRRIAAVARTSHERVRRILASRPARGA